MLRGQTCLRQKLPFFPHSLVRIDKKLCQFFEKLVRLRVTCAAAPALLVAPQNKAWVDFGNASHFLLALGLIG